MAFRPQALVFPSPSLPPYPRCPLAYARHVQHLVRQQLVDDEVHGLLPLLLQSSRVGNLLLLGHVAPAGGQEVVPVLLHLRSGRVNERRGGSPK